jgi:hypothetical protein
VTVTAASKIVLHRDPGNAAWRFVSAEVAAAGREFAVRVNPNGQQVVIDDRCETRGAHPYSVTVELDGERYDAASCRAAGLARTTRRVIRERARFGGAAAARPAPAGGRAAGVVSSRPPAPPPSPGRRP